MRSIAGTDRNMCRAAGWCGYPNDIHDSIICYKTMNIQFYGKPIFFNLK